MPIWSGPLSPEFVRKAILHTGVIYETESQRAQDGFAYLRMERGCKSQDLAEAKSLGLRIAGGGWDLVYGETSIGLMDATADAALSGGAEAIGVLPQALQDREIAHRGLTRLHIVGSVRERKALMASLSDAFIALPGGYGTLDEFFEVSSTSFVDL